MEEPQSISSNAAFFIRAVYRVSHYPSGTIDMFLTLIDIAGLSPDSINAVNDGVSLVPVIKNEEPSRREKPMGFRVKAGQAWLDNDWKLVRNYTSRSGP